MYITENYIDNVLLEASRWKEALKFGKIGEEALLKLKQFRQKGDPYIAKQLVKSEEVKKAEEYLNKKGIIQSFEKWLNSIKKGIDEKLKRHDNIKISHFDEKGENKITSLIQSSHTYEPKTGFHIIRIPDPNIINKKNRAEYYSRLNHEIDESIASMRMNKNIKSSKDLLGNTNYYRAYKIGTSLKNHQSPKVLKNEKEYFSQHIPLYKNKGLVKDNYRRKNNSIEEYLYQYRNKAEYPLFTNLTNTEIRKIEKNGTQLANIKYEIDKNKKMLKSESRISKLKQEYEKVAKETHEIYAKGWKRAGIENKTSNIDWKDLLLNQG